MDICSLRLAAAAIFLSSMGAAQVSHAQGTDGYHAIQVFPVVVDTAAFTQRFQFRTVPSAPIDISVTFYPADGTVHTAPVTCQTFLASHAGARSFSSLRDLCPALAPGSAFGTLIARNAEGISFAAASRVNNAAGSGFAVEAFPASDFTIATTSVTGLRRLAAQGGAPAYQTNCFVGSLAELAPSGPPALNKVTLSLADAGGQLIGTKELDVKPGQLIRLLDVFAAVGVPTGNYDDVVATFTTAEETGAGLISFCTVQDNTHFGADFRIGKQEDAFLLRSPGAFDEIAARNSWTGYEVSLDDPIVGARLAIPAGSSRNVHIFYFRNPDIVSCWLSGSDDLPIGAAYGLEMRLRVYDSDGLRILAGGNDSTGFSGLYLGDKPRRSEGANTAYHVDVESNGQNDAGSRPYALSCSSGSGHYHGTLAAKGLPLAF